EAIELMKSRKFHVIVCDQRMPAITGVEVLRRARDLSPDSVRILLTGYSDTDAILGAINDVEVHRFLQKPWDNPKLKQVIDEAIRLTHKLAAVAPGGAEAPEPAAASGDDPVERLSAEVLQFPQHRKAVPDPALPVLVNEIDIDLDHQETVLIIDPGTSLLDQT